MSTHNHVGILGAGAMGAGIAQVAATHGWTVTLMDLNSEIVEKAVAGIGKRLDRMVEKGRLDQADAEATSARIRCGSRPQDIEDCSLLIEAVIEDLDAKAQALAPLVAAATDDLIIATNTSSLSVTEIGQRLGAPERTCGMHFFNPAPIMKLVEIISGQETDPLVTDRVATIADSWGKHVARAADTPGFIVNRVARPYYLEAFRCLEDGLASVELIDDTMKSLGGFRMGPFELTDFIGHDVNTATTRTVWSQWKEPSRLMPSRMQEELVSSGQLGRKTGRGAYDYQGDSPIVALLPGKEAATIHAGELDPIQRFTQKASRGSDDPVQQIVFARILCALMNEALWAKADGVATEQDIDTAMKYGVNYPRGPFEWMADTGPEYTAEAMKSLESMTAAGRFIPPA
ncbi:MAG: 3-hydroxyacyl-CoA dehydrogenase NAD-binding domain-containing protein [Phycisphaerales bacterium]|nr:3-hydroxyacyl-CoA dehydrogenase NAD-binding domain-containing protein [Phycisphaerales bacterium]